MLDGLIHSPKDVAEALTRHQVKLLAFRSLRFQSDGAAKALKRYRGKSEIPLVEPTVAACHGGATKWG